MARWYVRCCDCLQVAAVDDRPPTGALCGACGGKIEAMGKVHIDRLVVGHRSEIPCDGRCTGASGPNCDCSCGGANHGSGKLVEVEVTEGLPRVKILAKPEAMAVAEEWRALQQKVLALPGREPYDLMATGHSIPDRDYRRACAYRRSLYLLQSVRSVRTAALRKKKVDEILARFSEATRG